MKSTNMKHPYHDTINNHKVHIAVMMTASKEITDGVIDILNNRYISTEEPLEIESTSKRNKRPLTYYLKYKDEDGIVKTDNPANQHTILLLTTYGFFGQGVNIEARLKDLVAQLQWEIDGFVDMLSNGEYTEGSVSVQARVMEPHCKVLFREKVVASATIGFVERDVNLSRIKEENMEFLDYCRIDSTLAKLVNSWLKMK